MPKTISFSFRTAIPLVLFVFSSAMVAIGMKYNRTTAYEHVRQNSAKNLRHWVSSLENALEADLAKGDFHSAQRRVSTMAADPTVSKIILLNHEDQVLISSELPFVGKGHDELPDLLGFKVNEILRNNKEHLSKNLEPLIMDKHQGGNVLIGFFPILIPDNENILYFPNVGTIIFVKDISILIDEVDLIVEQQAILFLIVIFALTLALAVFFHLALSERLTRLVASIQRIALGNYEEPIQVKGNDEIGSLGFELERMAKRIQSATQEKTELLKSLQQSNRELEQVLYVASHDLRSPLVNIQGFSKELQQSFHDLEEILGQEKISEVNKRRINLLLREDIDEAFHFIFTSTNKMEALLAGVLKISRLGRMELHPVHIQAREMIEGILKTFEYVTQDREIRIRLEEEIPNCIADSNLLNQVFSNIIGNAINYLDQHRIGKINVGGSKGPDGVTYWIKDNGIGIPPDQYRRIFGLFQRLQSQEVPGEGIGLSIVYKIIEQHGGKVWVESEEGLGSTFFFTIPYLHQIDS